MLWAEFHASKETEIVWTILTALGGAVFCGVIPYIIGVMMRQPTVGIICGFISGAAGALSPCCLGVPACIIMSGVIGVVGLALRNSQPASAIPIADDEELARGFQLPGSSFDDTPSGMSDRERERRHQQKYGFRPRPRRPDPPPESDF